MLGLSHALRGLFFLVRTERNARVHGLMTLAVVGLGILLGITLQEWCWLVMAISSVWCAEAFNTAIERLADRVTEERDPLIKQAKDLAAGAVLCAATGAAVIGILVLGPYLWRSLWA